MHARSLLVALLLFAGCAPRQDPGIPLPPPQSAATALHRADVAVGRQADIVAGIDAAKRVVLDNLANADTTGYKARTCQVIDGHPQITLSVEQGALQSTNRDFDVGIAGQGFFRVKVDPNLGDGLAYTRNGNFFRNNNGDLVVGIGDGYRLDPPINIPRNATELKISPDGVVSARCAGEVTPMTLGQIDLSLFVNPSALTAMGGTLYQESQLSGNAIEVRPGEGNAGQLQQDFLEASNVDLTREKLRTQYLDRWRSTVLAAVDVGP